MLTLLTHHTGGELGHFQLGHRQKEETAEPWIPPEQFRTNNERLSWLIGSVLSVQDRRRLNPHCLPEMAKQAINKLQHWSEAHHPSSSTLSASSQPCDGTAYPERGIRLPCLFHNHSRAAVPGHLDSALGSSETFQARRPQRAWLA